jgi:hypothetical protein
MATFEDITISLPAVLLAAVGLGLTLYAAMETEPEDIARRALFGVLGLLLMIAGAVLM